MDQKYLTDSESLSLNIEATCLLLLSPRNFQYEIKMNKYNPYPSMISMFTTDSQHPPKSRHAVHLGAKAHISLHNQTESDYATKIGSETVKIFFSVDGLVSAMFTSTVSDDFETTFFCMRSTYV